MKWTAFVCLGILAAGRLASAPPTPPAAGLAEAEVRRILKHSPVPELPRDETNAKADDEAAARLGQALFFDARLSGNGRIACATCHAPEKSWTDGRDLAMGVARATRNAPSLWNVAYNRWFFWDGRADSVWSQALKPIESPAEMGGSRQAAVQLVKSDARLRRAYEQVFGPPELGSTNWTFVNIGKAIAAYERRLLSRRAPFDVFAEGLREGDVAKQAALKESARRGLLLFVGRGKCSVCHTGPLFTDGEFHDLGVPLHDELSAPDPGRALGLTRLLEDEFGAASVYSDERDGPRARAVRYVAPRADVSGQVKTPSLRNVALSAPYMHQGQFGSLRAVLGFYSTLEGRRGSPATQERVLQPLRLSDQELDDLQAFLESLTDTSLDPALLHPPALP